jgi:peptide/nickel transport system permease protein
MVLLYQTFELSIGGLFSPEYVEAAWGWKKFIDLLKHLPIPILVVGLSGATSIIRMMRGSLLDELKQQYVITARSKGVGEKKLLFEYPVRIALNPIISNIGVLLPGIVSQTIIAGIVLNLPTTGPLLYQALLNQDMFLAGSIVMLLSFLTVIWMFLSDILLVIVDPRIRLEKKQT